MTEFSDQSKVDERLGGAEMRQFQSNPGQPLAPSSDLNLETAPMDDISLPMRQLFQQPSMAPAFPV